MTQKTILITRPLRDAVPIAEALEPKGFRPFIEPMISIKPVDAQIPNLAGYQGIIFTSANGVRYFSMVSNCRTVTAYVVGTNTAREAFENGFSRVVCGDGDAKQLSQMIDEDELIPGGKLLHVSGEDVAAEFNIKDMNVKRISVYKAHKVDELTPALLELIEQGGIDAAMFFSARTAESFGELLGKYGLEKGISSTKALCISDSVVKSLDNLPWGDVQIAQSPNRKGMLALLGV